MKLAVVHDYLNQFGGAEKVLEAIHQVWPEAPIYTSIYDKDLMVGLGFDSSGMDIRTSFMQKIPFLKYFPRYYFTFLYPFAFYSFDLNDYDVILSTASYAAKDIKKPREATHISYIHTPPRFLYGFDQETSVNKMSSLEKLLAKIWKVYLLYRDQKSVKNVDYFLANSKNVQKRIKNIYHRDSFVIYPPVETAEFTGHSEDRGYFLVVSRLGEYKKVDLAVRAFNELKMPLKVVGSGPQLSQLQKMAEPNVEVLGRLPRSAVIKLILECRALIFVTEEDFGITPVEAMSAGKPVIAYRKGGALETVVEGKTGLFFDEQSVESITKVVKAFDPGKYLVSDCQKRAREFDKEIFQRKIKDFVIQVSSAKIS